MSKKTVVDAVNALGVDVLNYSKWNHIRFTESIDTFTLCHGNPNSDFYKDSEFVCPRGAFEIYVDSLQNGKKTVVDVVAEFGRSLLSNTKWTHVRFDQNSGKLFPTCLSVQGWSGSYKVCTRNQYEAYLSAGSDGDKWTHIDEDGSICRILHTIDDKAWVTYKRKDYLDDVVKLIDLKPYEPEWTHLDETNELCKVVADTPDIKGWIVILKKRTGMYEITPKGHVQPCH